MGRVTLSREAYNKLYADLQTLKSVERAKIARAIQEAREKGDLSENAEYDAAKEAQGLLEAKIAKLEATLASSQIIDKSTVDTSKAYIYATVKLKNLKTRRNVTYQLVSEQEANLREKKLSVQSPVGKALLGKVEGDEIPVKVPAGLLKFKILTISYDL